MLANSAYFWFGNDQSIGSVDLQPGFIGNTSYNSIPVIVQVVVANWAGPIWWTMGAVKLLAAKHSTSGKEGLRNNTTNGKEVNGKAVNGHVANGKGVGGHQPRVVRTLDDNSLENAFIRHLYTQTVIMGAVILALMTSIIWTGDKPVVWDIHAPRLIFTCVYTIFVHFAGLALIITVLTWLVLKPWHSLNG